MSKSQSKRSLGNTPLKQNSSAIGVSLNGALHEQRLALLTYFGNIPVDFMMDRIVPFSGITTSSVECRSQAGGSLLDAGWKAFIDALPKDTAADKERKVFRKSELFIIASTTDLHVLLHWS